MKRFVSRYEKIRHLRAQQEDTCRAAAAARNAERNTAEAFRDQISARLEHFQQTAAREMAMGLTGALFQSVASQIERTILELRNADENLQAAESRLQEALVLHRQARAELKVVEEVVHREKTEHRKQQLKEQDHQLQEQAAQAFYREQLLNWSSES